MAGKARFQKVVVIGLDGLEPKLVAPMLAAGELPNLAALQSQGGFATVATTSPAQTPVAWSTFATGTNPGGHGVFDFIRRDPATYRPDLALNRYEQKSAWLPPKAVNLRRGTPFWDVLGAAGVASTVLRCPCTYPPAVGRGRMLAGMGVPDLRGGLGTATFFSTAADLSARESESVARLEIDPASDGRYTTRLPGPRSSKDRSFLNVELTVVADVAARSVTVRAAGEAAGVVVREREWSDWLRVKFKAGLLQSVSGLVRFYLVGLGPARELELYASPLNFDPEAPPFPISAPADYARALAADIGRYYTSGMVEDHAGLNNGRIDEWAFLDQCMGVWDEREAMMLHELGRLDEGLFYCLFDTPDRVQHMFWRFLEPDHPSNAGVAPTPELARVVADQYRRADAAVGRAVEAAGDRALVIVLSDHGFGSFRRGFHINSWLHAHGLLALRDGARPGDPGAAFPDAIDWSRTRAYALGLGGVYLNLEGREGQGIVPLGAAEALKAEIARALTGLVDPATGAVAVRAVKTREELYHGPYVHEAPDLAVHLAAGQRISWESTLGGVPEGLFEDNVKRWSGDHIIDPALVPGVLLMNGPFRGAGAGLADLAPTILDAFGVEPGADMEGRSLLR